MAMVQQQRGLWRCCMRTMGPELAKDKQQTVSAMSEEVYIHPTAEVSPRAKLGSGSKVWHQAQVREDAVLGRNCILGKGVYIDFGVQIGDNVKIQNQASVYHGVTLENGVFVGPHVIFTNDKLPRAINPDGSLKSDDDWDLGRILVKEGASL